MNKNGQGSYRFCKIKRTLEGVDHIVESSGLILELYSLFVDVLFFIFYDSFVIMVRLHKVSRRSNFYLPYFDFRKGNFLNTVEKQVISCTKHNYGDCLQPVAKFDCRVLVMLDFKMF